MNSTIEKLFQNMDQELNEHDGYLTNGIIDNVRNILAEKTDPDELENVLLQLAQSAEAAETTIFFYSVALYVKHSPSVFGSLLDYCLTYKESLPVDTLHFLYGQFAHIIFVYSELETFENTVKIWQLLDYIVSRFETGVSDLLTPIPQELRNDNFVLVLTNQFVGYLHGPTKTAADRCKILMEHMGKSVLLINTSELMTDRGYTPFWDWRRANYNSDLLNAQQVEWKSCTIPYFQCDNNMPDADVIRILLSSIRQQKPSYIISIGSGNIVAALASKIVPTLCVGLGPSKLSTTGITYQTLSRALNDYDKRLLHAVNRPLNSVIIGTFGSSILEQTSHISRAEAGLPAETWLGVLVGGRLDQELNAAFWDMAAHATQQSGIEYVILGNFSQNSLNAAISAHPVLEGKIHPMGTVKDVLCYMELCDLYINPTRSGGGTSCVEAMSVGLPVLTTDFGDVAVNVGEQFHTQSYDTMVSLIDRYMTDFAFYQAQSIAAKNRAAKLLNAEENFKQTVSDFLARANR